MEHGQTCRRSDRFRSPGQWRYRRARVDHLARANLGLEKLRHFFRLAIELKFLDGRRYEHAARALDEIGRLVGPAEWDSPEAKRLIRAVMP